VNNGDIYEGEWKDGLQNGQGKKSYLINDLLILTLFNTFKGKYSFNSGTIYIGEFKDSRYDGQGKKSDLLILTLLNT